jgi:putative IMPACT (imprinted ancient) family translation regulator
MTTPYNIPASEQQFEFEIKRSQFICYAAPAAHREAADHFIRSIRERQRLMRVLLDLTWVQ